MCKTQKIKIDNKRHNLQQNRHNNSEKTVQDLRWQCSPSELLDHKIVQRINIGNVETRLELHPRPWQPWPQDSTPLPPSPPALAIRYTTNLNRAYTFAHIPNLEKSWKVAKFDGGEHVAHYFCIFLKMSIWHSNPQWWSSFAELRKEAGIVCPHNNSTVQTSSNVIMLTCRCLADSVHMLAWKTFSK